MIFAKDFIIHTRLIVKTFNKTFGHYLHKIMISRIILSKKYKMIISVISRPCLFVESRPRCNIYLASDNRFSSFLQGCPVKIDHAIHDTMICNSKAVHAQLLSLRHNLINLTQAVKQTVFRMHMKVCKCHSYLHSGPPLCGHSIIL